ncbi:MAG: PAS domain S-box protein, partial [Actinomycetia bacterium]|nr:PAS domain S-box protein [Actinomycetes bacterium]
MNTKINNKKLKKHQDSKKIVKIEHDLEIIKNTIESNINPAVLASLNGRIIYANESFLKLWGYNKKAEVLGRSVIEFTEFKRKILRDIKEVQKKGGWTGEQVAKRKNGSTFVVQTLANLIKDVNGAPVCMQASFVDLSLKKEAEETLKKSQHRLSERIKELNCLYSISKLIEKPKISLEEIFGGTIKFIPPGWHFPEITCARIITPDQEFKTDNFKDTIWKLKDDINIKGEKYGTLEICYLEEKPELYEGPFLKEERDLINAITDQLERIIVVRLTQKILADNEARFRELFKNMSSGVTVYEATDGGSDFIIRDINSAGEKINKIKRKDLIGNKLKDVFPEVKENRIIDVLKKVYKTGKSLNYAIKIYKDSKISVWIENYLYKLPTGDIVVIYDDVTKQKLAEEVLQEKHNQMRIILNSIPDHICFKNRESRIILCNQVYAEIMGKSDFNEVIGKTDYDFFPKKIADKYFSEEQEIIKKGKPVWEKGEVVLNQKSKKKIFVLTSHVPLKDSKGKVTGLVSVARDITTIKEGSEKLARSNKELTMARKEAEASAQEAINANKTKSEFLSNMSHEIRTP